MIEIRNRIGMIFGLALGLISTCHADMGRYSEVPSPQSKQDRTTSGPQSRTPPPDIHVLSQLFGHFIGKDMKDQGIELNVDDVIAGLEAGVQGKPPPVSEADYEEMIGHYRDRGFQEQSKANLVLANAFLKSNARNEGVRELVPGKLQYKVLKHGRGVIVQENGTPQIYYTGQFIDGTMFGGTEPGKGAVAVHLPDMIPGFQQGVTGMHEGEKRRLYVHPDLAYGVSKEVPKQPNAILFFDIEVVNAGSNPPKQIPQQTAQKLKSPRPAPVVMHEEVDDWDLPLNTSYEEEEEEDFSTQPFQLQSVNPKRSEK